MKSPASYGDSGQPGIYALFSLAELLTALKVSELFLCGMMTQNCITHTALSKMAAPYQISVIKDACTTVNAMIHGIAINALSVRTRLITTEAFKGD